MIKSGGCLSPQTPPSGKYLHQAIVPAVYEIQLPSSISFGDMEGPKIKKWGLLMFPDAPVADKFLHVAIVPSNAIQYNTIQYNIKNL